MGGGLDDRLRPRQRVGRLEDARTHEDRLGAELHRECGIGGGRQAARAEQRDGERAGLGDLLHERERRAELLGPVEQLGGVGLGDAPDVAGDRTEVADRLDDVAGARLALRTDHRGTLGDSTERLAEVGRTADERHVERELVDVVRLIGGGEHLGLVDEVDAERLDDLRFDEVPDTHLGHHGDRHGGLDPLDHLGIAHPCDTTIAADVGGYPFERHHGDRPGVLRDRCLLGGDDVHDDAALHHLGQSTLDRERAGVTTFAHASIVRSTHRLRPAGFRCYPYQPAPTPEKWRIRRAQRDESSTERGLRSAWGDQAGQISIGRPGLAGSSVGTASDSSIQVLPGVSSIGSPSSSKNSRENSENSRFQRPSIT